MTTTTPKTVRIREYSEHATNDWRLEGVKQRNASSSIPSEFVGEAEYDKSIHRSPDSQETVSTVGIKSATSHRDTATTSQSDSQGPTVCDLVHFAITSSGYPLHHLRCWSDEETLTLSGLVTRYFHLQIALEIAKRLANGRRIENHINVEHAPDRDPYTD